MGTGRTSGETTAAGDTPNDGPRKTARSGAGRIPNRRRTKPSHRRPRQAAWAATGLARFPDGRAAAETSDDGDQAAAVGLATQRLGAELGTG